MQDWREMKKQVQELWLKLRKRLNQRTARCSAPAAAEERKEESCETLRKKREALEQRRIRTSDIASLAQIERELSAAGSHSGLGVLFCPGFYRVTASRRRCPAGSAL